MQTVSIIVPAYKAVEWIQQCLDSIKAQTYKDVELIVIDDTQGTGAAAARNRGLDKATGELVAFCDADDYLEPDAIEKMVAVIEGVDIVIGSFRKFGKFDQVVTTWTMTTWTMPEVSKYAITNMRHPRYNQMLSGCWAKLYRRSLIGRFPIITTAEDMAFNFDYLTRCEKARFIPNIVYHNRKHEGSLSTTFDTNNKKGLFGFLEALKYARKFLMPHVPFDEIEEALDNSKVYHAMLYFMRICAQDGGEPRDVLKRLYT